MLSLLIKTGNKVKKKDYISFKVYNFTPNRFKKITTMVSLFKKLPVNEILGKATRQSSEDRGREQ